MINFHIKFEFTEQIRLNYIVTTDHFYHLKHMLHGKPALVLLEKKFPSQPTVHLLLSCVWTFS